MDIKPPKRQQPLPTAQYQQRPMSVRPKSEQEKLPISDIMLELPQTATPSEPGHKKRFSRAAKVLIGAVLVIFLAITGAFGWYQWAIGAFSSDTVQQDFAVNPGDNISVIGKHLEQQHLIRSAFAFELYVRLHGETNQLKAGSYRLMPSQSVATMTQLLLKGDDSVYSVFIPPGLTLKQLADPTVKGSFAAQGFSQDEIQQAFKARYVSLLLKDKPAEASLEGYIFPETFQVKRGDSLSSVLERSFDVLYDKLQRDGLMQKFSEKQLSLYQALTLGSIIQKETSVPTTQAKVAQVFLNRLQIGMTLGSDVTFMYAAQQLGVTPTADLSSPYNTRIHAGLPPGPIATMNYSALEAVANPAPGDYLFFVAGDDGTVYFSHTNEEHEQQVQQYCKKLCSGQ